MDLDHDIGRISGNVTTLDPGANSLTILGSKGVILPTGTTANRVNTAGSIRYNSDTGLVEAYSGSAWVNLGNSTLDSLSDVAILSPTSGQVLAYNGTEWNNSVVAASAYSVNIGAWTLLSGNQYYADVTHNLGTQSISVSFWNIANNELIQPGKVVITGNNTIRVTVTGNSRTLRCTVIANGMSIAAGNSTPSSIILKSLGTNIANTPHTALNFTGTGVTVTDAGSGTATININAAPTLRSFTYYSASLESPNNADWVVNALAPAVSDPTNAAIVVRQFSNTVEQGVGCLVTVPPGATNITFRFKGRATTAPGAAAVVQHKLYVRSLPANAAVGAWSAATNLSNITIPTNAFFQYASQTLSIASLGMAVNGMYQFELTRATTVTGGTQLANNWLLAEFTVEFT